MPVKRAILGGHSRRSSRGSRHLSAEELKEFVGELIDATYDAAQLDVHGNLHRVVVEWRATARILADPSSPHSSPAGCRTRTTAR